MLKVTVLVVEDETLVRMCEAQALVTIGFKVEQASNGKEAVSILKRITVSAVVTDLKMPEMDGFELIAWMRENRSDIPVIVATGDQKDETANRLQNLGVSTILSKPIGLEQIRSAIHNCLA